MPLAAAFAALSRLTTSPLCFIYDFSTICLVLYLLEGLGNVSEHAILGFLNAQARSGYDLKTRCFDVEAEAFWNADQAQIYRTLERLKSGPAGQRDRDAASRASRTARSTRSPPAGRDAFAALGDAPQLRSRPRVTPSSSRSTSRATRPTTRSSALLSDRRAAHQARLDELRAQAIELSRDHTVPARVAAMRQAAYDGAIATERATIDWLDDILEAISDGLLPGSEISEPGTQNPLFGWAPA